MYLFLTLYKSSAGNFQNYHFQKNSFRNTIRILNGLDPDQDRQNFTNSLDPDQDRQNVGPDLGPNC